MDLSQPLPDKGVSVPIYITTAGIKGVPVLSFGKNGYSPRLRLFDDHIEFKLIRAHCSTYQQIEFVDTVSWNSSRHLEFAWNDSRFTFKAMVIREDWLIQVLHFLHRKNVNLTPKAQSVMNKETSK